MRKRILSHDVFKCCKYEADFRVKCLTLLGDLKKRRGGLLLLASVKHEEGHEDVQIGRLLQLSI